MAFTYSGFKKSLNLVITKTAHPTNVETVINENGQGEFIFNGTTYPQLTDDEFSKLVSNGVDGTWEVRKNAFIAYMADKYALEPDLLYSIPWQDSRIEVVEILITIAQLAGSSENNIHGSSSARMSEIVDVVVKDYISNNEYTLSFSGLGFDSLEMDPADSIKNLVLVSITPEYGTYAHYSVNIVGAIIPV